MGNTRKVDLMDELDARILELLESDSRQSNTQLASKLKVSEGTVRNRIARMLKERTIQKFSVVVGGKRMFRALVLMETLASLQTEKIVEDLRRIREIKKFHEVSGEWDVVAEVACESSEKFNDVIEKIRTTKGVTRTESLVVLKIS